MVGKDKTGHEGGIEKDIRGPGGDGEGPVPLQT